MRACAAPDRPGRAAGAGRARACGSSTATSGAWKPPCSRPPTKSPAALWDNSGLLAHNFAVTAEEVLLGLALALAAGLAMAIAIHVSPVLRRAFYPLAVGSQAMPIPVIGVLLVFWWGFGIFPKLS